MTIARPRGLGVHDSHGRTRVRRHARVGLDDDRRCRGARRNRARAGLDIRAGSSGTRGRGPARARRARTLARRARADLARLRGAAPQRRPARDRVLRAVGGRPRALGPARTAARRAADLAPAGRARPRAGLRERRLLLVRRSTGCASSSAAGSTSGIPRVKMKLGREPAPRPGSPRRGARGDRRRRRAVRRRERRASAPRRRCAGRGAMSSEWDVTWFEEPVSSADFAGAAPRARRTRRSTSPRVSTPTSPRTSATSSAASTACRPTSRAAAASPACCASTGSLRARPRRLGSLRAATLRTRVLRRSTGSATWSISTTTSAIEAMLFDGVLEPVDGVLVPDRSRPGHGLELKRADAQRWAA